MNLVQNPSLTYDAPLIMSPNDDVKLVYATPAPTVRCRDPFENLRAGRGEDYVNVDLVANSSGVIAASAISPLTRQLIHEFGMFKLELRASAFNNPTRANVVIDYPVMRNGGLTGGATTGSPAVCSYRIYRRQQTFTVTFPADGRPRTIYGRIARSFGSASPIALALDERAAIMLDSTTHAAATDPRLIDPSGTFSTDVEKGGALILSASGLPGGTSNPGALTFVPLWEGINEYDECLNFMRQSLTGVTFK